MSGGYAYGQYEPTETMPSVEDLRALKARVDASKGPDREIDAELWAMCGLPSNWTIADARLAKEMGIGKFLDRRQEKIGGCSWRLPIGGGEGSDWCFGVRQYTASIDAALALLGRVLPGWKWTVAETYGEGIPGPFYADLASTEWIDGKEGAPEANEAHGTIPTLALISALLAALIAKGQSR